MGWIFTGSLLWPAYLYLRYYDVCSAPSNLVIVVDLGQHAVQENARDEPQDNSWKQAPAGPHLRNWNHHYLKLSLLVLDCAMKIKAPSTGGSDQSSNKIRNGFPHKIGILGLSKRLSTSTLIALENRLKTAS